MEYLIQTGKDQWKFPTYFIDCDKNTIYSTTECGGDLVKVYKRKSYAERKVAKLKERFVAMADDIKLITFDEEGKIIQ